jgi:hypothetical protein
MGALMETNKRTAFKKGATAAAVGAAGVVLTIAAHPILGVIGLVGGGALAVDWFMFRARRGMRF